MQARAGTHLHFLGVRAHIFPPVSVMAPASRRSPPTARPVPAQPASGYRPYFCTAPERASTFSGSRYPARLLPLVTM